ncbi:MAG: hypothetical protein PSX42_04220 [bacterium]|nr:hypothetical protein [bacterium]
MKKVVFSFVILATWLLSLPLFSQIQSEPTALGLPGDNLNLYAVLDVFQKSKTLEEFERVINSRDSNINNLDLNNDNVIDYIEVISYKEGNSYSIVLRVAINSYEYQDVAVIDVNKNSSGRINVQIIGDEELYGDNYIVEPYYSETVNPGYAGNQNIIIDNYHNGILYADYWPIVIHLYSPIYRLYISPWHWGFYPSYWSPWTPVFYHDYWRYHYIYYRNRPYRRTVYLRDPIHYSYYSTRRNYSPIVRRNRINGDYNRVYDGRVYKRPEAPTRSLDRPLNRENRPLNRSIPTRENPRTVPENRGDRPAVPLNRRVLPAARPESRPENRQGAPVNSRQSNQPANRPSVPLNRRPFNKPVDRQPAPSNPRQANPPVNRQRVPENRPERINRNSPPPAAPKTDRPAPVRDKN